jgi:hypothetical protein
MQEQRGRMNILDLEQTKQHNIQVSHAATKVKVYQLNFNFIFLCNIRQKSDTHCQ